MQQMLEYEHYAHVLALSMPAVFDTNQGNQSQIVHARKSAWFTVLFAASTAILHAKRFRRVTTEAS
jgi:branched-subunit amino acid transport protein